MVLVPLDPLCPFICPVGGQPSAANTDSPWKKCLRAPDLPFYRFRFWIWGCRNLSKTVSESLKDSEMCSSGLLFCFWRGRWSMNRFISRAPAAFWVTDREASLEHQKSCWWVKTALPVTFQQFLLVIVSSSRKCVSHFLFWLHFNLLSTCSLVLRK